MGTGARLVVMPPPFGRSPREDNISLICSSEHDGHHHHANMEDNKDDDNHGEGRGGGGFNCDSDEKEDEKEEDNNIKPKGVCDSRGG